MKQKNKTECDLFVYNVYYKSFGKDLESVHILATNKKEALKKAIINLPENTDTIQVYKNFNLIDLI